ncbi:MAG: hypothetical protein KGH92_00205 [Xanthomonadaceae bacterium]|nr:hypothetical protein [Xanthomonadaceae bacterium]
MFSRLRQNLHAFVRAHHARMREGRHALRTVLAVGLGLPLLALGVIMLVLPGPGVLTGLVGAALIAGESAFAARLLDRAGLWTMRCWRCWGK